MPNVSYLVLIPNIYLDVRQIELPFWFKQVYSNASTDTDSNIG